MSQNLADLQPYRSQHLILLVGGNPLPNWVAAKLLYKVPENFEAPVIREEWREYKKKQPKIWLLHSDDNKNDPSTKDIAIRLQTLLAKHLFPGAGIDCVPIELLGIPSSSSNGINDQLDKISTGWRGAESIGLNYTGGTKPMALHVYRYLEAKIKDDKSGLENTKITFSYLDSRHTTLWIDGSNARFHLLKSTELRELVSISQEDLAALHGYKPPDTAPGKTWITGEENPAIYSLAQAIGRVYAKGGTFKDKWISWLKTAPTVPPDPEKYETLEEVINAMDCLAGGRDKKPEEKAQAIADALKPGAKKGFASCYLWFVGAWLEEYARHAMLLVAKTCQEIHGVGRNILFVADVSEKEADSFELDSAAMLGYQLFAISCTTAGAMIYDANIENINIPKSLEILTKKDTAKEHLMEIYVRARQLGGDEARVGLVCFYDNRDRLEGEIRRSWDAEGKVKVFVQSDFENLEEAFYHWFRESL